IAVERAGPGLAHHALAERVVGVLAGEGEPGRLVDLAGGRQLVVGPQGDVGVPDLTAELQALPDEGGAETEAAGPRLDQQQAEPGGGLAVGYAEDRARRDAVALRDPARGAGRVGV